MKKIFIIILSVICLVSCLVIPVSAVEVADTMPNTDFLNLIDYDKVVLTIHSPKYYPEENMYGEPFNPRVDTDAFYAYHEYIPEFQQYIKNGVLDISYGSDLSNYIKGVMYSQGIISQVSSYPDLLTYFTLDFTLKETYTYNSIMPFGCFTTSTDTDIVSSMGSDYCAFATYNSIMEFWYWNSPYAGINYKTTDNYKNANIYTISEPKSGVLNYYAGPEQSFNCFTFCFGTPSWFGYFSDVQADFDNYSIYFTIGDLTPEQSYTLGYEAGYNSGYTDGLEQGYDNGYNKGYDDGVSNENDFNSLINAVLFVPVNTLSSLLSFDILGVNMLDFAYSIFSIFLITAVLKKVL